MQFSRPLPSRNNEEGMLSLVFWSNWNIPIESSDRFEIVEEPRCSPSISNVIVTALGSEVIAINLKRLLMPANYWKRDRFLQGTVLIGIHQSLRIANWKWFCMMRILAAFIRLENFAKIRPIAQGTTINSTNTGLLASGVAFRRIFSEDSRFG